MEYPRKSKTKKLMLSVPSSHGKLYIFSESIYFWVEKSIPILCKMLSTPENMIEKTDVEINIGNITTGIVLLNKVDIRTITMQNAMLPKNAKA